MSKSNPAGQALGPVPQQESSNRYMIKGLFTGALILAMMIPTIFIYNLVHEREQRQKDVAAEVSQKWSAAQTFSGPYIFLPYRHLEKSPDGRITESQRHLWILPEQLNVDGQVDQEVRKRSIYNVLLYRANLQVKGSFMFQLPKDLDASLVLWQDAKICAGISDFKGIEERIFVRFGDVVYELSPGLPSNEIDKKGLSAGISLNAANLEKPWNFATSLRLKGSGKLHFKPLSANSDYSLRSKWPDPSFDGNSLPGEREVSDSGFVAKWNFNKANLPYGTVLRDFNIDEEAIAFGLSLLQPADHYSKADRSVKYAILIIGLTFSLFFIMEILQKKPVHPVQYILVGLALVIFYTLLLSISEFIAFDIAYLVSSMATVLLIALYARAHFRKWSSALLFGGILALLYGFIFVLIRLEDTALLVGSIALFLVLALVMFASRKVNWYGTQPVVPDALPAR
jgi:inner membrane protein